MNSLQKISSNDIGTPVHIPPPNSETTSVVVITASHRFAILARKFCLVLASIPVFVATLQPFPGDIPSGYFLFLALKHNEKKNCDADMYHETTKTGEILFPREMCTGADHHRGLQ